MPNADVPVEGSAVDVSGRNFTIRAKSFAKDGNNFLLVRTTPGKKIHIFVQANTKDPTSSKFDEDVDNKHWKLVISERP